MIEQAFEVATEFRFDIGQAMLSTKALQDGINDVSKAADGAVSSLNYLASGLVAHLGFGSGGLLSVLTKAVQISEAFNQSALNFSNNISSNINYLTGDVETFNKRLAVSQQIMGDISGVAIKTGLDTGQLASITQLVSSPLAARGKLGKNYEGGISMAKNMMLASESVGLPQHMGAESLARALSPGQSVGGKLFERLINTAAFRGMHVLHPQQLGNMNQDKKIELLSKALEQLAGDADFLRYRMQHIGTQFTVLKNQIEVLLKPIGDAFVKPIVKIMSAVNMYLNTHGKEIGDNIAKFIGNIFEDPKNLLINLLQLKEAGRDFKKSMKIVEIIQTLTFLKWGLEKLGITFAGGLVVRGLKLLAEGLQLASGWIWRMGIIGRVFSLIGTALRMFVPQLMAVYFFLQTISRARAIAKVNDAVALVTLAPKFMAVFAKIKDAMSNILMPLTMAMDFWARLIAPLFESSTWLNILLPILELFADGVELLGKACVLSLGAVSALTYMWIGFVDDIMKGHNPFKNMVANMKTGFNDFMAQHPFNDKKSPTALSVINIGKQDIRFDMREQLEPDRIAFAVTTHLKKLAMNPTQGRGQSHGAAFAGAT